MLNMHISFLRLLSALERALNIMEANNKYFHKVTFFWGETTPIPTRYDWRTCSFPINHKRVFFIDLSLIGMGGACLDMICLVTCLNSLPFHVGTITMCINKFHMQMTCDVPATSNIATTIH